MLELNPMISGLCPPRISLQFLLPTVQVRDIQELIAYGPDVIHCVFGGIMFLYPVGCLIIPNKSLQRFLIVK